MRLPACVTAIALVCGASGAWAGAGPHAFASDPSRCVVCHSAPSGGGELRRDAVSLCLECHGDKDLSTLHPVDIRPGARVPDDLPLDERGTIHCATCHDPHGPHEADEPYVSPSLAERLVSLVTGRKRYRTFYLRRPNDRGQLCLGCHDGGILATEGFHVREESVIDAYAGSAACGECHRELYDEWLRTPHARMTRDAREDAAAVLGDFETDAPFPAGELVYALGTHWLQRYVVDRGGRLFVAGAAWAIPQGRWDDGYWTEKPWDQYCQGCHTTGFEWRNGPRFVELGVGCEACHGPGRRHASSGRPEEVVNPADLTEGRRDMVCESCHTLGHDRTGQFRFPLGYLPGRDLARYYRGLLPKPGQDNTTFSGDGTYEDRHRQWLFWVGSFLEARGAPCDACQSFRGRRARQEKARMTPSEFCLSCHAGDRPGDRVHAGHADRGVECHRCHVPSVDRSGRRQSVHDHKFFFGEPATEPFPTPRESCGGCHGRGGLSSRG